MTEVLRLAFYKGTGHLDDRIIRTVTRSPFSHVELVRMRPTWPLREAISASGRDGGVRIKPISFRADQWQFLHLMDWVAEDAWVRAEAHLGASYDYRGILLSQALPLRRHAADKWFCSELCAHALGLREPHRLAPGDLYNVVHDMNAAFMRGVLAA